MDMIRVNIHLAQRQLERLRQLARDTGLTVAEIVRRAIDTYLKGEDSGKKVEGDKKE